MSERKAIIGRLTTRLGMLKEQIDTDVRELEAEEWEPSRETVETISRHFGDDFYEINVLLNRARDLSAAPPPPPIDPPSAFED